MRILFLLLVASQLLRPWASGEEFLCVGRDGHVCLENTGADCCCAKAAAASQHHAPPAGVPGIGATPCDDCIDIPIAGSALAPTKAPALKPQAPVADLAFAQDLSAAVDLVGAVAPEAIAAYDPHPNLQHLATTKLLC